MPSPKPTPVCTILPPSCGNAEIPSPMAPIAEPGIANKLLTMPLSSLKMLGIPSIFGGFSFGVGEIEARAGVPSVRDVGRRDAVGRAGPITGVVRARFERGADGPMIGASDMIRN